MQQLEIEEICTPKSARHLNFLFSPVCVIEFKSENPKSGLLTSHIFPSKGCAYPKPEFGLFSLQIA